MGMLGRSNKGQGTISLWFKKNKNFGPYNTQMVLLELLA